MPAFDRFKDRAQDDDRGPDLDALFTNRFVGKVKLTPAELATAEKSAEPFRRYVG